MPVSESNVAITVRRLLSPPSSRTRSLPHMYTTSPLSDTISPCARSAVTRCALAGSHDTFAPSAMRSR